MFVMGNQDARKQVWGWQETGSCHHSSLTAARVISRASSMLKSHYKFQLQKYSFLSISSAN